MTGLHISGRVDRSRLASIVASRELRAVSHPPPSLEAVEAVEAAETVTGALAGLLREVPTWSCRDRAAGRGWR